MPPAPPEFNVPKLLKLIDTNDLGKHWRLRYPDLFERLEHFRREIGDKCNYTRACLINLWSFEVTRDVDGFYAALRDAAY